MISIRRQARCSGAESVIFFPGPCPVEVIVAAPDRSPRSESQAHVSTINLCRAHSSSADSEIITLSLISV